MISKKESKRVKKWKENHKSNGLCVDCNEKAVEGYIRCQKHLNDRNNLRNS